MSYEDDSGVIYDERGNPIGARPKVIKLPDGTTWSRYESKRSVRARMSQQPPEESSGFDINLNGGSSDIMSDVADMFGFRQTGPAPAMPRSKARARDPFDFSDFFT